MDTINDFEFKQRKYMPVFQKQTAKRLSILKVIRVKMTNLCPQPIFTANKSQDFTNSSSDTSLSMNRYTSALTVLSIIVKATSENVSHLIFTSSSGVAKYPLRRSFYTWAEGAAPVAVFEFFSDATARQDRNEKVGVYLNDIGVQEYFIHQPELKKPAEFRGWRQDPSGRIVEMEPDAEGGLFSEALNLYFRWEEQHHTHVRLLRPYLPDGTPITTPLEEHHLREAAQARTEEEIQLRQAAQARTEEEITVETGSTSTHRRRNTVETGQHKHAQKKKHNADKVPKNLAATETQRRQDAEAELEKLRTQLANLQRQ